MIKLLPRIRSRKMGIPVEKSYFTETYLNKTAQDVQKSRYGKKITRPRLRDNVVIGLHATINHSGLITFHADYDIDGVRYYLLIGSMNEERDDCITVEKARERTRTVKALAERGINPQDGLYPRLWKELDDQGIDWEPRIPDKRKSRVRSIK